MAASIAALAVMLAQSGNDAYRLPIGRPGTMTVSPGEFGDLRSGNRTTFNDFLVSTDHSRFVYLGEQHATAAHQALEAKVIRGLVERGRSVIVGVEMFQRPKQDTLDAWTAGKLSEADFLTQSDWKTQWGFDYSFYRPVFDTVRELGLPLVALNVPRSWVHTVAESGFDSLPMSAKLQLPVDLFMGNREHRRIFDTLMAGHSVSGPSMDQMYAAQVLWDEGMADTALKYLARIPTTTRTMFVVIAGAGHVLYEQGINYRVARRHGAGGSTLVMIESDSPVEVSRGLANFVAVTPKPATPSK